MTICNQFPIRRLDARAWHHWLAIGHYTYRLAILWNRASIYSHFRDNGHQTYRGHDLDLSWSRDVIGHVVIESPGIAVSYRCSIVTKSLSPAIFEIMGTKDIGVMTLTFPGHLTSSSCHVTIRLGMVHFLLVVFGPKSLSLAVSEIFRPNIMCSYRQNAESSLRMRDITWHVPPM